MSYFVLPNSVVNCCNVNFSGVITSVELERDSWFFLLPIS